jgi:hypothetical protein
MFVSRQILEKRRIARERCRPVSPCLEWLEDRTAPAVVTLTLPTNIGADIGVAGEEDSFRFTLTQAGTTANAPIVGSITGTVIEL